ncbi:hypothetical protein MTO96_050081 [Rhipicephalus appendiculatus]
MEAVPRDLPQGGQAECCPSATSTSTSIKGSSGCGLSTETSTITSRFILDTEASNSGCGTLAGTPLVGQQSRSAKGVANDDECDSKDGEPHDPVDDPAVHGDTVRESHGKEDHGDGGDNKKTAVEGSGRSQARQRVRRHSKAYDMHGDEDCVGGNEVDVVDKPYIRVKVRVGSASSGQDQLRCRGRRQR